MSDKFICNHCSNSLSTKHRLEEHIKSCAVKKYLDNNETLKLLSNFYQLHKKFIEEIVNDAIDNLNNDTMTMLKDYDIVYQIILDKIEKYLENKNIIILKFIQNYFDIRHQIKIYCYQNFNTSMSFCTKLIEDILQDNYINMLEFTFTKNTEKTNTTYHYIKPCYLRHTYCDYKPGVFVAITEYDNITKDKKEYYYNSNKLETIKIYKNNNIYKVEKYHIFSSKLTSTIDHFDDRIEYTTYNKNGETTVEVKFTDGKILLCNKDKNGLLHKDSYPATKLYNNDAILKIKECEFFNHGNKCFLSKLEFEYKNNRKLLSKIHYETLEDVNPVIINDTENFTEEMLTETTYFKLFKRKMNKKLFIPSYNDYVTCSIEEYYKMYSNNDIVLHRLYNDGPSQIITDQLTGKLISVKYFYEGDLHHKLLQGKPIWIDYNINSEVVFCMLSDDNNELYISNKSTYDIEITNNSFVSSNTKHYVLNYCDPEDLVMFRPEKDIKPKRTKIENIIDKNIVENTNTAKDDNNTNINEITLSFIMMTKKQKLDYFEQLLNKPNYLKTYLFFNHCSHYFDKDKFKSKLNKLNIKKEEQELFQDFLEQIN